MPITSNASYLPSIDEFLAHWSQVNTVLGVTPLIIKGGLAVAGLQGLRATLVQNHTDVQTQRNEVQLARNTMRLVRVVLLDALNKFNGLVDGYYGGTIFEGARPKVPGLNVNLQDFSDPMQDARSLWVRMEAAVLPTGLTPPLSLPVTVPALLGQPPATAVTLTTFTALLASLQTAQASIKTAEMNLALARKSRDATQDTIYEALKNYRLTVPSKLNTAHVLLQTMPRLTPEGGHTPAAVNAQAEFQEPEVAKITFDASTDPDLDHYELHAVVGEEWNAEDADVIATLPKDASPLQFVTTFGLTSPGGSATFSVYVVLTTGNVKGSTPMTVVRPG
jgi:hypothetical protein